MITVECVGGPRDGEIHTVATPRNAEQANDLALCSGTRKLGTPATDAVDAAAASRYRVQFHAGYGCLRPALTREGHVRAVFAGWVK